MKNFNFVLGVDVSKKTLDICCCRLGLHIRVDNNDKGFMAFKKWSKENHIDLVRTLVVMEYTGGYEYCFLQYCESISLDYCRVPGLEIKCSTGMARGKSDRTDSYRIGRYGEEKLDILAPAKPLNKAILLLKQYLSFRKRLVRENAGLKSTIKERKHMYGSKDTEPIVAICLKKIAANERDILKIEKQIISMIESNEEMRQNYQLLTSIKGVGNINAWMAMAYTENFESFTDARKYAVAVGVIPFEHTSGTSIKGRKRVSHIANKEVKQELNQAAKSAMVHDPQIRAYAERKLRDKAYPLVLNNVKFKLILRMFAVVKRKQKYVENYIKAA